MLLKISRISKVEVEMTQSGSFIEHNVKKANQENNWYFNFTNHSFKLTSTLNQVKQDILIFSLTS